MSEGGAAAALDLDRLAPAGVSAHDADRVLGHREGARQQLDHLEPADDTALKRIITKHMEETGSTVAKRLLDNWGEASSKFIKVFPREYKRVLAEQRYDSEIGALATGM